MIALYLLLVWYVIGYCGFAYLVTEICDFSIGDALVGLIGGLVGPGWFAIYLFEHTEILNKALVKKRGTK